MFWPFIIAFGVFYAVQTVLALRQATNYSKFYGAMRRRGQVAIGKQKNLLVSGAIVMFLLDDDGRVVEGVRMSGVTVFSRFRRFDAFDGQLLAQLRPEGHRELPGSVRAAVANARDNYLLVTQGLVPAEPPGPVTRIAQRFRRPQRAVA